MAREARSRTQEIRLAAPCGRSILPHGAVSRISAAPLDVISLAAVRGDLAHVAAQTDPIPTEVQFPRSGGHAVGPRVTKLCDRLPADLREVPSGPDFDALPFTSLYMTGDEWAAEIANRTVHGVMHLGWVPDGTGGYRGQMAVLVKPNGLLGTVYMAAIKPFRYLIVYPALMREIGRDWQALATHPAPANADAARLGYGHDVRYSWPGLAAKSGLWHPSRLRRRNRGDRRGPC